MSGNKNKCRWFLVALPVTLLAWSANPAFAQLINASFDDNGGSLTGWTAFNNVSSNVSAESITPRSGSHVLKVYGTFDGSSNWSGVLQNQLASAGQTWEARVFVRHNSSDALAGNNAASLKIEFYRVAGAAYGTSDMLGETGIEILNSGSPQGVWQEHVLSAPAPADTVEARVVLLFNQQANATGAALFEDVSFTPDSGPPPTAWTLVWQDEFDGPSIDPSKWRVEDIHLLKNNELQYYAPDDVYLQNGNLVLRSLQRSYWGFDEDGNWRHFDYTSGLVETQNRFSTTFGKIEVRAKMPVTQGIWPAHWMLPTSGAWPPEIDIMELLGHEPDRVHMSQHWGSWPNVQSFSTSYVGPDFGQGFHTFAVEWWPDRLVWLVDGVVRATHTTNIPQEPFYIILNTAVGGNWPGNPDGSTIFPQYHEIDYVRVYTPGSAQDALLEVDDTTGSTATADGVMDPGEYVGSINGINSGLADRIGEESIFFMDSSSDGRLNLAFDSKNPWGSPSQYGVVVYIDSVAGGFSSTATLNAVSDRGQRLASGKGISGQQADLYFAPNFSADYAISFESDIVRIYQLGESAHTLINGANLDAPTDLSGGNDVTYRIDDGSAGQTVREFETLISYFGIGQGDSLQLVATMLNGDNAFRTNEFVGVATGNEWDGANIGPLTAVLKLGDFIRFTTAPEPVCSNGDLDCDGSVTLSDASPFAMALTDPNNYAASFPMCDACGADMNGDGLLDGNDIEGFIDLLVGP